MFRFNRLVVVLAVCAIVTAAFAGALKIKGLTPIGLGLTENPDGDGMAIANYHEGNDRTEVTAAITEFMPDTSYNVLVWPGIEWPVVTNAAGNSTSHGFITQDICLYNDLGVFMFVWRDDNGDGFRAPCADPNDVCPGPEDRAWGHVACP